MQRCVLCDQASDLYVRLLAAQRIAVDPVRRQRLERIGQRAMWRFWARWNLHSRIAVITTAPLQADVRHHARYGFQRRAVQAAERMTIVE